MPKQSPYTINLTEEEERERKRRSVKYTLPYFQVMRAQIILLAAEGRQNDQIAAQLNTHRDIVSKWRKRFYYQRLEGLEERPRPGRPRTSHPRGDHSGEGSGV